MWFDAVDCRPPRGHRNAGHSESQPLHASHLTHHLALPTVALLAWRTTLFESERLGAATGATADLRPFRRRRLCDVA